MSNTRDVKAFRQNQATKLVRFADLIRRHVDGNIDTGPIYKAIAQLRNMDYVPQAKDGTRKSSYWGYEIEGFTVPITTLRHVRPSNVTHAEFVLNMQVVADYEVWDDMSDPFLKLNFNVMVRGIAQSAETKIHYMGFHIDRHIDKDESEEPHPVYHIQYSPNPSNHKNFDYGSVLHLDTPRIVHYPMDFILGMGFLLSNFSPTKFDNLLNDGAFVNMYREHQNRVWKPYSQSVAAHWPYDIGSIIWKPSTILCPFLA